MKLKLLATTKQGLWAGIDRERDGARQIKKTGRFP
jgi:hypothetical protein